VPPAKTVKLQRRLAAPEDQGRPLEPAAATQLIPGCRERRKGAAVGGGRQAWGDHWSEIAGAHTRNREGWRGRRRIWWVAGLSGTRAGPRQASPAGSGRWYTVRGRAGERWSPAGFSRGATSRTAAGRPQCTAPGRRDRGWWPGGSCHRAPGNTATSWPPIRMSGATQRCRWPPACKPPGAGSPGAGAPSPPPTLSTATSSDP